MPSPRLLVIEGNSPQTSAEHVAAGGTPASKGYSDLLRELLPGVSVDICYPGEASALLPEGSSLEGYDGIAITGSSLHIYNGGPEVTRQIELVRTALKRSEEHTSELQSLRQLVCRLLLEKKK